MSAESFLDGRVALHCGDSREVLKTLPDNSIDAVVTDPPYHLMSVVKRFGEQFSRPSGGFMGCKWDVPDSPVIDPGFAHWLAGFIDGEGCFSVHKKMVNGCETYDCQFSMQLRADDKQIVIETQKQLGGIGTIADRPAPANPGNSKPQVRYCISSQRDCQRLREVLRVFPLRAKKARDFEIWSQALDAWIAHEPGSSWEEVAYFRKALMDVRRYGADYHPSQLWAYQWAREVYRVLKPGGHILVFGGTRTYHRLACAIEDAGFEIRDTIMWVYGQGFPKSLDVAKSIDRAAGAERPIVGKTQKSVASMAPGEGNFSDDNYQWQPEFDRTAPATDAARQWDGWHTALKPSVEPCVLARKPLSEGTVAENVLRWGTGAINVNGCRVDSPEIGEPHFSAVAQSRYVGVFNNGNRSKVEPRITSAVPQGRWPANLIHDGSPEVLAAFPDNLQSGKEVSRSEKTAVGYRPNAFGAESRPAGVTTEWYGDSGSAARFFYEAKPDGNGRDGEASAERRYTDEGATNFAALPGQRRDGVPPSRMFYQVAQDCLCGLCGMLYDATCNAVNAANGSSTKSIQTDVSVATDAVVSPQHESKDINHQLRDCANNAGNHLQQCHPHMVDSVQENALHLLLTKIVQNVKSAASLCDSCATVIARSLVAMRQGQSLELIRFQDFISGHNAQILIHHLALYAAGRESTDIILTTPSLKQLFGSVFRVIENSIDQSVERQLELNVKSKRLWYGSKADSNDRLGSSHPTVKPLDLIQYLIRLITPPNGVVLDCFAGTGTTGEAAFREGMRAVLIEREPEYQADIRRRMALVLAGPAERARESVKARGKVESAGPLFDGL
jgi:DNA modification methylase